MTDTVRTGPRTSEFRGAVGVTALLAFAFENSADPSVKIAAIIGASLVASAYAISRGLAKKGVNDERA